MSPKLEDEGYHARLNRMEERLDDLVDSQHEMGRNLDKLLQLIKAKDKIIYASMALLGALAGAEKVVGLL